MILLKRIFTWWNSQTIGTFLTILFFGRFVGKDQFGNKYYESKNGKRWVVYRDIVEASKIPPEWFYWIHHKTKETPKEHKDKFKWQIEHFENLTGTDKSYKPKGSLVSEEIIDHKKYDSWKP